MHTCSDEELHRLIGDVYTAATSREGWTSFFSGFAQARHATMAAFIVGDLRSGANRASHTGGVDAPDAEREYNNYFSALNPFHSSGFGTGLGVVAPTLNHCPLAKLRQTLFYDKFFRPFDLLHGLGV